MKAADFNNLVTYIKNEIQGFSRHYKLYDEVYILRNSDKTKCIEFRFVCSNIVSIQKYNLLKSESDIVIDGVLTNESTYKLTAIQSVKMLKLLEAIY